MYRLLLLVGIVGSGWYWYRNAKQDRRWAAIYIAALCGAFIGAKLGYLAVEGRLDLAHQDWLQRWATGKTVIGALAGGFVSVEAAKKLLGWKSATGDAFAVMAPIGIGLGRMGCWKAGCCLGVRCAHEWYAIPDSAGDFRWPAVPLDWAFQWLFAASAWFCRSKGYFRNQLFHLYLIAYGSFRFFVEWKRDTPKFAGGWSGYQLLSLLLVLIGGIGYWNRHRKRQVGGSESSTDSTVSVSPVGG